MNKQIKKLTLDNLISIGGCNAEYWVACVGGNFGNDYVAFLLPCIDHFDANTLEHQINLDCLFIPDLTFEDRYMLSGWLKEFPELPFIVIGNSVLQCIEI